VAVAVVAQGIYGGLGDPPSAGPEG